jgi:hypothetical protein
VVSLQLALDGLCDITEVAAMNVPNRKTRGGGIHLLDAD